MRALVLTLAAVSALSGCGGSSASQPKTLPAISVAPSPSPVAPSAAATGINAPTPQGASQFAIFVYAQIESAFHSKNPALIEAVATPGCSSCTNFINSVKRTIAANDHVEGFHITVHTAVAPATTPTSARVDIVRESSGGTFVDPAGKVVLREPALRGIEERMDLVRESGRWLVAQIVRVRVRQ